LVPQLQSDVGEAVEQRGQAAGYAFVDSQLVDHLFPLPVLSVEARREPTALVIDVTGERRAEMAGHQPCTRAGAMVQRRAPALARTDGLAAGEAVPFRVKDLDGVMQDVATEQCLLAARFELDGDGARGCGRAPARSRDSRRAGPRRRPSGSVPLRRQ